MSGIAKLCGWQLLRDGCIGLVLFSLVAALAISDGAQAGVGYLPVSQDQTAIFSDPAHQTGAPAPSEANQPKRTGLWTTNTFQASEKSKAFHALIPLSLLFAIAFAFSAALLRHVVGTYALARVPAPLPVRQRSRRRFDP